jgi:hypothetical protein
MMMKRKMLVKTMKRTNPRSSIEIDFNGENLLNQCQEKVNMCNTTLTMIRRRHSTFGRTGTPPRDPQTLFQMASEATDGNDASAGRTGDWILWFLGWYSAVNVCF